jgi:hypothetical protein
LALLTINKINSEKPILKRVITGPPTPHPALAKRPIIAAQTCTRHRK